MGNDGGGGSCIPQRRRLVFLGSALGAACEAGEEQNFAFSSPWGLGGQRASPHDYIIPEVQHSLGLETQQRFKEGSGLYVRVCILALEGASVVLLESGEGERVSLLGCSLLFLKRNGEQ